jgi:catechol 2,3-dioxygenase-like lactoylglutathione lyase family enzyme
MGAHPPPIDGILETVLYCDSSNEDETTSFYREVLHLPQKAQMAFRVSETQVLLLFNADRSARQTDPPPHGTRGPGHACFVVPADRYEDWKTYLEGRGVPLVPELEWPNGARSFYFHDPSGNLLEICDGDLWPR